MAVVDVLMHPTRRSRYIRYVAYFVGIVWILALVAKCGGVG